MKISINAHSSGTATFPEFLEKYSLANLKAKLMKDPEFREIYYEPNHVAMELGIIRRMKGVTQEDLAEKMGTTQSSIARAENSDKIIGLRFLHKMARALDCYLKISVEEERK